jgi:tetratricopeptide (TPR) repeat protein
MSAHICHTFNQIKIVICTLFLIYCLNIGCAVEKGKVYTKDGKDYGRTDGLFKAAWDDYYLRGISYSEGAYWEDAAADFAAALQKRGEDQRRARTYGMHFIDYFPNRELGIAYFNMKRYRDAIDALEASLARVESARAKFYLDKARRAWLDDTRLDTTAPAIAVDFPPSEYRTKDFSIALKGTANDDFFVSSIVLNGRSSPLELSQKEVSFQEEILLRQGKNVITLQSEDILGKTSSPLTIQVKVDREGPLVFLEVQRTGSNALSVTGAVYDQSPLAKLTLHDRTRAFDGTNFTRVAEQFSPARLKEAVIQFEAEDILGNKTRGSLNGVRSLKNRTTLSITDFPRVPSRKLFAVSAVKREMENSSNLDLRGLRDGLTMYLDTLTVEGMVTAGEGIEDLAINNQSLLAFDADSSGTRFLKLLREKGGRSLAFAKGPPECFDLSLYRDKKGRRQYP